MPGSLPIPHPEWECLAEQHTALHAQIARALADLHALEDSRPVVLGRYAAAFGERLLRLHRLEIEAARLKREIELVQTAINNGREIDYQVICDTLDEEFAAWQEKLEAEAALLEKQRGVLEHLMEPETVRTMDKLFRQLVRRLHPDLHEGQSDAETELWHRVLAAYEERDLEELQALEILTREPAHDLPTGPDPLDALRNQVERLRLLLDRRLLAIADTRRLWPFDQEVLLDDPAAVATQQSSLDDRLRELAQLSDERKQWLGTLLDRGSE
ncbi:MAG: hypothetical protein GXX91_11080 [Verrucomicrobiaceae bacterium]|nr:hypothetical protein [Verrucomicrobiaceae bacterium]